MGKITNSTKLFCKACLLLLVICLATIRVCVFRCDDFGCRTFLIIKKKGNGSMEGRIVGGCVPGESAYELILDMAEKRYQEVIKEQDLMKNQGSFLMTIISLLITAIITLWNAYLNHIEVRHEWANIAFIVLMTLLLIDLLIIIISQILIGRPAIPNPKEILIKSFIQRVYLKIDDSRHKIQLKEDKLYFKKCELLREYATQ